MAEGLFLVVTARVYSFFTGFSAVANVCSFPRTRKMGRCQPCVKDHRSCDGIRPICGRCLERIRKGATPDCVPYVYKHRPQDKGEARAPTRVGPLQPDLREDANLDYPGVNNQEPSIKWPQHHQIADADALLSLNSNSYSRIFSSTPTGNPYYESLIARYLPAATISAEQYIPAEGLAQPDIHYPTMNPFQVAPDDHIDWSSWLMDSYYHEDNAQAAAPCVGQHHAQIGNSKSHSQSQLQSGFRPSADDQAMISAGVSYVQNNLDGSPGVNNNNLSPDLESWLDDRIAARNRAETLGQQQQQQEEARIVDYSDSAQPDLGYDPLRYVFWLQFNCLTPRETTQYHTCTTNVGM